MSECLVKNESSTAVHVTSPGPAEIRLFWGMLLNFLNKLITSLSLSIRKSDTHMLTVFQFGKDKLCADMSAVYDGLISAVKHRREYAKSWTSFGQNASVMAISQLPDHKEKLEEFAKLFAEVGEIHMELANKEERNAEDFRDVIERFAVVYRVNEEYNIRKEQWDDACKELEKAQRTIDVESQKPTYSSKAPKLQANLEKAKQLKRDCLRRYKRKVLQFIRVKEQYCKFKVRRIKHGFLLYAEAMREAARKEMDVFVRIRDHLNNLKSGDEPVAAAVAEQLSQEAPAPAPVAAASEVIEQPVPEPVHDEVYAEAQKEEEQVGVGDNPFD